MTTSDFWDWAVAAYSGQGIAARCLELQDTHAQCVPLLLFGAWAAQSGVTLDSELTEAATDTARAWSESVIAPIRSVRQHLKKPVSDIDDAARMRIRDQVKAVELEAERALMTALSDLLTSVEARPLTTDAAIIAAAQANLVGLSRLWGGVVHRTGLFSLIDALSQGRFLGYNPPQ